MQRLLLLALLTVMVGCGGPEQVAEKVSVSGIVILADGRPARDVILSLQPVERGQVAGLLVGADGKFAGEVVPGRYAYFVSAQDGKAAAHRAVPRAFHEASKDRTLAVPAGGELKLVLK